jgi:phosphoribosylformylglycinamidine synthase
MASKGGVGIDIDVASVPLRERDMEPFEIMVSESQERMLCVVLPELVGEVIAVCDRWETLATPIGTITASDPAGLASFRVLRGGQVVGELPVSLLVDDCPLYDLDPEPPGEQLYAAPTPVLAHDASTGETLLALLASANLASRRTVFEQYDSVVQSRTVRRPEDADAAVLRLNPDAHGGASAIAISIDGNARRVAADPRAWTVEAVLECVANLACVGAEPLGVTNCLNFGNPEKPHVAWQLTEAIEGLREACLAVGAPVVGGNVSLYNESPAGPILPTPVVGIVGKLPDAARAGRLGFDRAGDQIALIGPFNPSLAASELGKLRGEPPLGPLPFKEMQAILDAQARVRDAVRSQALQNAHDIAEGGIAVALAECCIAGGIGARVGLPEGLDPFGEDFGTGFVVSGSPEALAGMTVIGEVGGDALEIDGLLKLPVSELAAAHRGGLDGLLR